MGTELKNEIRLTQTKGGMRALRNIMVAALSLMDSTPEKLSAMLQGDAESTVAQVDRYLAKKYFQQQFQVKFRAKVEYYEGRPQVRINVQRLEPVQYDVDGAYCLGELKEHFAGASEDAKLE